jgi:hypothetical protein
MTGRNTTPRNARTMTLKLKRREVIDILLAIDAVEEPADGNKHKWELLGETIRTYLADFDRNCEE